MRSAGGWVMKIAVIGAGNVGGALANRWAEAGHQVKVGVRDPNSQKSQQFMENAHRAVEITTIPIAARWAEAALLATPWNAAHDALLATGGLSGKILIDATNPLIQGMKLSIGTTTSAAEQIAEWVPEAKVVKAFNSTGAANMINPSYDNQKVDMFICGNDDAAKQVVAELVRDVGMEVYDCGPLYMARQLEPLAVLWIYLAYDAGMGPNIMFKLVRR
jgi:8-hydroxy-5-deazaflavin:NADPH oxidoreductase